MEGLGRELNTPTPPPTHTLPPVRKGCGGVGLSAERPGGGGAEGGRVEEVHAVGEREGELEAGVVPDPPFLPLPMIKRGRRMGRGGGATLLLPT